MRIVRMRLAGHLTRESLTAALDAAEGQIAPRCRVLIDVLDMSGYDAAARSLFVDWNARHRDRIARVAILTDKQLWRIVISAMAFASGQQMKAFAVVDEAADWLRY